MLKVRTVPKRRRVLAASLFCLALAGPASAHVTLDLAEAPADSYVRAAIRVPHGCSGAATTGLVLDVPPGMASVKPAPKPGWTLTLQPGDPVASPESGRVAPSVREVTWRGGPLPDDEYDEFIVMFHTPATPGDTLWFAMVQECAGGAVVRWAERPRPGQPKPPHPAWGLRLTPKP